MGHISKMPKPYSAIVTFGHISCSEKGRWVLTDQVLQVNTGEHRFSFTKCINFIKLVKLLVSSNGYGCIHFIFTRQCDMILDRIYCFYQFHCFLWLIFNIDFKISETFKRMKG